MRFTSMSIARSCAATPLALATAMSVAFAPIGWAQTTAPDPATAEADAMTQTPAPADAASATAASASADGAADAQGALPPGAIAQVAGADGTAHGTATFTEGPSGGILVHMDFEAIPASGRHAVHVHEIGACEGPTFESAGGHLTGGKEHGILHAGGMHLGDMPNIMVSDEGVHSGEAFLEDATLDQLLDDDGSAVIIHAGVDDYMSQPSGDAGDRIACGVLNRAD